MTKVVTSHDSAIGDTNVKNRVGVMSIAITTDTSGDATETVLLNRKIEKILVKRGDLTSGAADVTITDNETAEGILALTNITGNTVDYIRRLLDGNDGVALTTVYDKFVVKTLKIVIAAGGNAKTGTVDIYYS